MSANKDALIKMQQETIEALRERVILLEARITSLTEQIAEYKWNG